ncbi:MAG: poly(3-hydroxyalkanoate) depolymerase [Nevskiales bacterium]
MTATVTTAAALGTSAVDGYYEEQLEIDGVPLRVAVRSGHGRPLLLFNGIGAHLELLRPFIDALEGVEIIIYDMPGIGGSPATVIPRRFSGLARLSAGLLDALGYTRPVNVAGISWGGALAQQFALQYPERSNRLILAATSAGVVAMPAHPKVLRHMITPRRYIQRGYMRKVAPILYGGEVRARPQLLTRHANFNLKPSLRGYFYQLIAGMGWTSAHRLPRLQAPTLLMAGDDDPLMPLVNMRLLDWLIPKSTLHVVRGGGHLFLVLRAHESAGVIRRFLSERRHDGTDPQDY